MQLQDVIGFGTLLIGFFGLILTIVTVFLNKRIDTDKDKNQQTSDIANNSYHLSQALSKELDRATDRIGALETQLTDAINNLKEVTNRCSTLESLYDGIVSRQMLLLEKLGMNKEEIDNFKDNKISVEIAAEIIRERIKKNIQVEVSNVN